jgi:hypothetical protein
MVSPNLPAEVKELDPRPFLSCHIYTPFGAEPSVYTAWPGRLGLLEQVEFRLKLEMELDHWFRLCLRLATSEGRQSLGPLFRTEFGDLDEVGVARTLRTLRGIESLLLGRCPFYPLIEASTKTATERVRALFDPSVRIKGDFEDSDWYVSLPLLLIRAAVWSQTGWQQPYLWEAYSAWHARQAHERRGWLRKPGRRILTFLVRFQSAPGQYARNTGDTRFVEAAWEVADSVELKPNLLLTALGVLAQAQDFRSAVLTPSSGGVAIQGPREEERRICGRHAYSHEPTDFAPFWKVVDDSSSLSQTEHPQATWSYSRWLAASLTEEEGKRFQDFVEKSHPNVIAFSFGRDYRSRAQQDRLVEEIRAVLAKPGDLSKLFTFNSIQVPDCLRQQTVETLVEIRLTDDVTAVDMVFRDCKPTGLPQQPSNAWEIYCRLFQTALDQNLILRGYCPTALVGRFLEAAYRLRPADCVSIPIRVNEARSLFLHLPEVPEGTDPGSREVQAAARYVPAWVLNQIMMQEVTSCQVALEDLGESEPGRFWRDVIKAAIGENHFKILFHKYLSDYLAEPSQVLLEQGHVDLLPPLEAPSADPGSEVQALLQAIEAEGVRKPESVVLGVDIGGTFVKMRFYRLSKDLSLHREASRLSPLGNNFRILTKATVKGVSPLDNFVQRLYERIREEVRLLGLRRVDAVGVSWPGPVRRQRVQGTSGILENLGFSRDIPGNDIAKIMEIDLARRLATLDFGTAQGAGQTVTVLNDGDAHALGTLAEAFLGRQLTSGDAAQLGVVVKAGTGTAGALIRNGLPASGLMEFGKLVVDLGYLPGEAPKFPRGVASSYCSSRTLPQLMRDRLPYLNHLDPPIESIEVGRLAEVALALDTGDQTKAQGVLRRLVWDAGKIAVAGFLRTIDPELDVVTLEELSRNWLKDTHPTLRKRVTRYLALGGADAQESQKQFRHRMRSYGTQRLLLLLNLEDIAANTLWKMFRRKDSASKEALTMLRQTADTACQAIDDLGIYVGDLLALLYFTHRMDYAVLGGGVLSHTSGLLARKAAVQRINKYNEIAAQAEDLAGNLSIRFRAGEPSSQLSTGPERASEHDPGTLGAALAGILELLRQKRLDGLKHVIEMVHRLELMDTLEITPIEVKELRKGSSVNLQAYALDMGRVRLHLDQAALRLGLVRTLTDDEGGKYTYTRWLAG